MTNIPDVVLDAMVESMMGSAAAVLAALVDRTVKPGSPSSVRAEGSLRVEEERVATTTDLPSLGGGFITRYSKAELGRVVGLMTGTEHEGEMDAMQLSIVAETVAQISSAMGDQLVQGLKLHADSITSRVVNEAGLFPPPPFTTYTTDLEVGDDFTMRVMVDFDGVALAKMGEKTMPKPVAAPAAAPAAPPPPARAARAVPASQPAQFAAMQPTPIHAAAPGHASLDLVHDIPLQISAVLGQTALSLREVVALQTGSVFELDKLSTDPIDLYVNNILIARGEVVVVDDKFAVKISELNPTAERS